MGVISHRFVTNSNFKYKRPVFSRSVSTFLQMVVALQSYLNDLTVESNIRRSARILVFNRQPWPADPKIAYMHANISQIKTAKIHYIFKVFKPRRVWSALDIHIISNDQQIKLILASGSSSSATISLDV